MCNSPVWEVGNSHTSHAGAHPARQEGQLGSRSLGEHHTASGIFSTDGGCEMVLQLSDFYMRKIIAIKKEKKDL